MSSCRYSSVLGSLTFKESLPVRDGLLHKLHCALKTCATRIAYAMKGPAGIEHCQWTPDGTHVVLVAAFRIRLAIWSLLEKVSSHQHFQYGHAHCNTT